MVNGQKYQSINYHTVNNMNERLHEMMMEATKDMPQGYYVPSEYFEKFAKLIVRECADIAKHHVVNISTYADADFVDEQIQKHFGVKE